MSEPYTPTTEEVRADYAYPWYEHHIGDTPLRTAAFDRWLADHDRQVAEKALRGAIRALDNADPGWPAYPYTPTEYLSDYLRRVERGDA